jgi:MFS family permease
MGATLGFRLLFMGFSQALQRLSLAGTQSSLILGILFLSMSLVALPLGNLQVRLGHQRGLLLGLTLMAGLGTIVPWISSPGLAVLMAILLGLTLGMISNSAVPFALTLVPLEWASLGTTIYFSGGSIAAALLAGTLASLQAFHPAIATLLGSGGCLLAGFFVASAMPLRQPKK